LQYLLAFSFYCFVILENCKFNFIVSNKEQSQLTTKVQQRNYLNNKKEYIIKKDISIFNIKSSQINRKKTIQFVIQRKENSLYRRYCFIENLIVIDQILLLKRI